MKSTFFLTLIAGLAASAVEGFNHVQKEGLRPQPVYEIETVEPSLHLDKVNLKQVPASSVLSSRQSPASDFYECRNSNPAPADNDCNNIIDEVFALDQPLIIASNACLLFQFGTCWGFFCALCQQLSTDTNFVGNQLVSAEALCVAGGQAGTLVSPDRPQWEAGFIYQGGSLPTYNVC
ncbi:hypothetical protein F4811DRAFT_357157 [Daldinia bambusicola]|nr:hypothetical protein F4811DRAFT_357157 [Daldinia bambusicola]